MHVGRRFFDSYKSTYVRSITQRGATEIVFSKQQLVPIKILNDQDKSFGELPRLNTLKAEG